MEYTKDHHARDPNACTLPKCNAQITRVRLLVCVCVCMCVTTLRELRLHTNCVIFIFHRIFHFVRLRSFRCSVICGYLLLNWLRFALLVTITEKSHPFTVDWCRQRRQWCPHAHFRLTRFGWWQWLWWWHGFIVHQSSSWSSLSLLSNVFDGRRITDCVLCDRINDFLSDRQILMA